MTDSKASRLFRKKLVRSYRGRGEVYSWLRAYQKEVTAALNREELTWSQLVAEPALDGVAARAGASLTANAALRVWQRVSRDVEADLAATLALKRRKFPSRISPDWRPQVVTPPPTPPTQAGVAGASQTTVAVAPRPDPRVGPRDPSLSPEAQATMDKIWADLDDEDARRFKF